jgi:hypothetical protein
MQPEVQDQALQLLGARGVVAVPCPPTGVAKVSALSASVSLFIRSSKGVDKSAGTSTILAMSSGSVVSTAT